MKTRKVGFAACAAAFTLVLACITVNIYFPEAAVKKTADEIVDEIRKQDANKAPEVKKVARTAPASGFTLVPMAFAQQETTVSNPAIRALKDSMKQRFPSLKPFYEGGNIGETNTGLVDVRDDSALNLKDKSTLRGLVKDENADRMNLYGEVAKALNIKASEIPRIQKLFAQSWQNAAQTGWWIQNEAGAWAKK